MSSLRELAPRPPGAAVEPLEQAKSSRKFKVAIACEACRSRRTKCDGVKPQCQACTTRDSPCEYAMSSGQLVTQAQKRKIDELETDKSALYEVLWYLQTTSPNQATALLQQLRLNPGGDIGGILDHFIKHRRTSVSASTTPINAASNSPLSLDAESTAATTPKSMDFAALLDTRDNTLQLDSIASPYVRDEHATVNGLDGPLEWFFNCVGALFYIMNRKEVQRNMDALRASPDAYTPLGDLVATGKDLHMATIAAELAGMASIGVVHAQLADLTTAPPANLADYFYAVAKMGLDAAIEFNPPRAIKICALLSMYNIVVHAKVALAYLDLGISLARKYRLDDSERPVARSDADHDDVSRTYRTLVHLQCWLSASLDYVPDALGTAALSATENDEAPPEDMIRRECVKVSIIKAEMLHRIAGKGPVAEDVVAKFRTRLSNFHLQLPDWMSLSHTTAEQNELMAQFRPVIFYVHLFYLSSMMLLSRRLVIAYIPLDAVGKVSIPPEARQAIEDGFVAAETNASVMEMMLSEGKIVQVCWLCIYTSYTAGVMIGYKATQKALNGLPYSRDVNLLNKCIKVLEYCALKDAMAGRFRDLLKSSVNIFRTNKETDPNPASTAEIEDAPLFDVLFTFTTGSSELHSAARYLFTLMHHPFSGLKDVSTQATLSNRAETTMGTHVEWEWELKGSDCMHKAAEPETVCGTNAGDEASVQHLMMQPEGGAWTIWTPPVGI